MMIVGMLASKVTISPGLVKGLILLIAKVAEEDAKESADLQLFRLSLMTLINLVQVLLCFSMQLYYRIIQYAF